MRTLGNIIWLIFGGFIGAAIWFLAGIAFCVTLVLIPFGVQCFKLARLTLWPFGKTVDTDASAHPVGNGCWAQFGGFIGAVAYFVVGVVLCITLIGIPFGRQCFKLARLSLDPFGATVSA